MEDSKLLDVGYGTPYVSILDAFAKPIIDGKNGLPIGMLTTSFSYEYDEKEDDVAEITIQTDNINLLDQEELGDKRKLILQWGWILPDGKLKVSQVRKVTIRDTEWSGNENGVTILLKCTDAFSVAKTNPADREANDFAEWVKYNLNGIETKFIDYRVRKVVRLNGNKYRIDNKEKK